MNIFSELFSLNFQKYHLHIEVFIIEKRRSFNTFKYAVVAKKILALQSMTLPVNV